MPTVTSERDDGRFDAPTVINAELVAMVEGVALAGQMHVIATRQAQPSGAAGMASNHRGQTRDRRGLGFLATEAAAHATCLDRHRMERDAQHFGNQFLNFTRVLA